MNKPIEIPIEVLENYSNIKQYVEGVLKTDIFRQWLPESLLWLNVTFLSGTDFVTVDEIMNELNRNNINLNVIEIEEALIKLRGSVKPTGHIKFQNLTGLLLNSKVE